jgi:hypothetical protein
LLLPAASRKGKRSFALNLENLPSKVNRKSTISTSKNLIKKTLLETWFLLQRKTWDIICNKNLVNSFAINLENLEKVE